MKTAFIGAATPLPGEGTPADVSATFRVTATRAVK
jgi:hypothetical protein